MCVLLNMMQEIFSNFFISSSKYTENIDYYQLDFSFKYFSNSELDDFVTTCYLKLSQNKKVLIHYSLRQLECYTKFMYIFCKTYIKIDSYEEFVDICLCNKIPFTYLKHVDDKL